MELLLWVELVVFVLLLGLSAFFSSSETSLFSLSQLQLEQMRRDGHPRIGLIDRMLNEPRRLIITILIGNELVNVAASVISAAVIIHFFGADSKWYNLLIMVPILLLVGEITPKTLAMRNNVAFASIESGLIDMFARLIAPIRWLVRKVADYFITMIVGKERSPGNIITEDMVRTLTVEALGEGTLDKHEAQLIDHIFDFGNKTLEDIMAPRSRLFFLPIEMPLPDMVDQALAAGYTRVPIFKEHRDNIVGILHTRDLLDTDLEHVSKELKCPKKLLRTTFFVPQTKLVSELFHDFRESKRSYALVVDEYGGVTGLVTMDDLLACIFQGDNADISEKDQIQIETISADQFAVDASISIAEFNKRTNSLLADNIAETLAGLLLHEHGELPIKDTVITMNQIKFTILDVKLNRVERVMFKKLMIE